MSRLGEKEEVELYGDDWDIVIQALDKLIHILELNADLEREIGELGQTEEKDTLYVLSSVTNELKREVESDAERI